MGARCTAIAALAIGSMALVGCSSTVGGQAVSATEAPRTETVTVAPSEAPSTTTPESSTPTALPDNGNGFTFVQTKSGKAQCRISATGAGCQLTFDSPAPTTEAGDTANGVNVGSDGTLTYVLGDIGVANPVTLEYATYTARGWTIEASFEGTRFTNDATGHGMFVSTAGARAF